MKGIKKLYFTVILLMISTLQMMAQQKITGRVIDDDGLPYRMQACNTKDIKSQFPATEKVSLPLIRNRDSCSP